MDARLFAEVAPFAALASNPLLGMNPDRQSSALCRSLSVMRLGTCGGQK
jgi:hypothetical protein